MNLREITDRFYQLVAPDLPNTWEVEDAVECLVDEPAAQCILAQVPIIWPISNSLCYNYLGQVKKALSCIRESELPAWVNATLDHYETGGLRAAQQFMVDVEQNFVCRLRGERGVRLIDIEGWLRPYIQGLSGKGLEIDSSPVAATDTRTMYLPDELTLFASEEDNILLYKLIAGYQWAFINQRTFFPDISTDTVDILPARHLQWFFDSFPDPLLAARLYHCLETLRAGFFLQRELPGLMRATHEIRQVLSTSPPLTGRTGFFAALEKACCLLESTTERTEPWLADALARLSVNGCASGASIDLCRKLYDQASREKDVLDRQSLVVQGEMRLQAVYAARRQRQKDIEEEFVEALSLHLLRLPEARRLLEERREKEEGGGGDGDQAIVLEHARKTVQDAEETLYLTIANESSELPDELREMAREMESDFGMNPALHVTSAVGRAGQYMAAGEQIPATEQQIINARATYDEWDYRRKGFRKNWCMLTEQEIKPVQSNFVPVTLSQYRGQIVRLRHQFEMMRCRERFLRRQRDGDDIDVDALVESLADTRAGLPPSDRLFIRLQRDERDIAVLFLVDMSNSTEGWVGTAIKESLVLICEAMEVLGDRYGIYGFSGMRRLRCETFHVKHLDEAYSDDVRRRIGAIAPREYTRMAPAIRHMTSIFQKIDARIRLLITLSDGKPEDYDEYKGEYAIEDTRHALLEAKSAGIHPFCITIDQHAHDYMAHMYGEVNYIFINDVRKLPARMPEIYRVLTS